MNNSFRIIPILERFRKDIEEYSHRVFEKKGGVLFDMLRYHFGFLDESGRKVSSPSMPGKLLRPTLCLMTVEALGGNVQKALPVAAAIEFVHNFSLIHDDIEDGDITRHGKPTLWKLYGKEQAINAGDALLMFGFQTLTKGDFGDTNSSSLHEALNCLIDATLSMTMGQERDMAFEKKDLVTVDEYIAMVKNKTGAMFTASIMLGAIIGYANSEISRSLKDFTETLVSFQIADDYLGIWGNALKTGKSSKNDILRRKKTYPIIYVLANCSGKDKAQFLNIYAKPVLTQDDVSRVLHILEKNDVQNHVRKVLDEYREKSFDIIRNMQLPDRAKEDYTAIINFFITRDY